LQVLLRRQRGHREQSEQDDEQATHLEPEPSGRCPDPSSRTMRAGWPRW
jgi:hypothetical protein